MFIKIAYGPKESNSAWPTKVRCHAHARREAVRELILKIPSNSDQFIPLPFGSRLNVMIIAVEINLLIPGRLQARRGHV